MMNRSYASLKWYSNPLLWPRESLLEYSRSKSQILKIDALNGSGEKTDRYISFAGLATGVFRSHGSLSIDRTLSSNDSSSPTAAQCEVPSTGLLEPNKRTADDG